MLEFIGRFIDPVADYEPTYDSERTFVEDPPDSKQVNEETPTNSPIYQSSPKRQHGRYMKQKLRRQDEAFYLGCIAGLERQLNEIVLDSQKADKEWELFEVVMQRKMGMKEREMSELKAQLAEKNAEVEAMKIAFANERNTKDEEIKKLREQLASEEAAHALQREKSAEAELRISNIEAVFARTQEDSQRKVEEAEKKAVIERRAHDATKARLKAAVENETASRPSMLLEIPRILRARRQQKQSSPPGTWK
ncbi:hypothetical protein DXG03_001211, partial [Asterophora parasitica]